MLNLKSKLEPTFAQMRVLHQKYQDYLPAIFFLLGFIVDVLTLGEIDDLSNIIMQIIYLFGAGLILLIEYQPELILETKFKSINFLSRYRNDIFHFFLGSLLSAFTLFYFKSGSFANSFLFFTFISSLLVLNEIERFQKLGILIRTSLFMLCLISFFIYVIPILIGKSGVLIFFLSTTVALMFTIVFFFFLNKVNNNKQSNIKTLLVPQVIVITIFVMFYLLKLFPPIPLSLKTIGIYHGLEKSNGAYITKKITPWWKFWNKSDEQFLARPDDKIYVFTKIFSPAGFEGKVFLHWLVDIGDGYMTSDRIPLNVTGGRSEGFRGFAYKSNYSPGDWQVRVETEDGLEIGRINFEVEIDSENDERSFISETH